MAKAKTKSKKIKQTKCNTPKKLWTIVRDIPVQHQPQPLAA